MNFDPSSGIGDLAALAARFAGPDDAPVPAAWFDIDGLIWLNDAEGFEAGDAAIAAFGRLVRDHASGLEVYRVRGDEFVVLPRKGHPATMDQMRTLAAAIIAAARATNIPITHPNQPERDRMTLSAAVFPADARLTNDRTQVCEELAHRVYLARTQAGRRYGILAEWDGHPSTNDPPSS